MLASLFITVAITSIVFICLVQTFTLSISRRITAICSFVLFAVLFILRDQLLELIYSGFYMVLAVFGPIFLIKILVREVHFWRLLYVSLLVVGMTSSMNMLLFLIVSIVIPSDLNPIVFDTITTSVFLMLCVISAKTDKLGKLFQNIIQIKAHQKAMLIVSVWLSTFLTSFLSMLYLQFPELPGLAVSGTLTAALIIIMGLVFPLLIVNSLSNGYYKNLAGIMDKQVQAQTAHYEAMSAKNADLRAFRHDYLNLRFGIISFLKKDDVEGALSYLEGREMTIDGLVGVYETGNAVLDALISEKQEHASAADASIVFHGAFPADMFSISDVCVIFGNALDNAIEACAKCSGVDKEIKVHSTMSKGYLFIKIINPVAADVKIVSNAVTTTKTTAGHGIGLQSIRASVERYGGDMTLSCDNGMFSLEIDFYTPHFDNTFL